MRKVLVIGGGGREHALVDALNDGSVEVFVAPGNAGTAGVAENIGIAAHDIEGLLLSADRMKPDLVVVGPEAPLVAGLADALRIRGIATLGPSGVAARLEGSKHFSKSVMAAAKVPTARFGAFTEPDGARAFARELDGKVAVKADGLAAGKGVIVTSNMEEAEAAIKAILEGAVGDAGKEIVVEERLEGEELSVLCLTDGKRVMLLPPAQDHKRALEGDRGPNTGGMGAYAPAPKGTEALLARVKEEILLPVVRQMDSIGAPFSGVLYAGLMLTSDGPKVLEFNVRFGDPETQVILPLVDESLFDLFSAAATGELENRAVRTTGESALTVVMASAGYPASSRKGDVIEGLEAAASTPKAKVFHAGTKREEDRVLTNGGRVLAVTGVGPTLRAAKMTAYAAVEKIHFDGAQFRRDIGWRALEEGGR